MQKQSCSRSRAAGVVIDDPDIYAELDRQSILRPFRNFLTSPETIWQAIIVGCELDVAFSRTATYECKATSN
jgi:hypothetical protein